MSFASEHSDASCVHAVSTAGKTFEAKARLDDIPAQLSISPLFAGLSYSEYCQVAAFARPRLFDRNQILFRQGESFRSLVLVLTGCVKLTRLDGNGSEVILALRGTGDALELPAGSPFCDHACSAGVVVSCKALTWTPLQVEALMARTSQISRNMNSILTAQIHDIQRRFHEASVDKVERRLACTLIRMTEQFGRPAGAGVELSISRQELAQMSGTTLFTVSRLISKWGELGLVLPRREAVLMLNARRLDHLSSLAQ